MSRWLLGFIFLFCAVSFAAALYLQHATGLDPCPLCLFQRVVGMIVAALALVSFFINPKKIGQYLIGRPTLLTSFVGVLIGARHVWLQHLPKDKVPECGPGLDFLIDVMPLQDVIQKVLSGSGECAEVQWQWLNLSLAEWTMAFMVLLFIMSLAYLIELPRSSRKQ